MTKDYGSLTSQTTSSNPGFYFKKRKFRRYGGKGAKELKRLEKHNHDRSGIVPRDLLVHSGFPRFSRRI